jgi:hypothetical protein
MFLRFEENPNTGFVDDRVFSEQSAPRVVTHVFRRRHGNDVWCPVTGLDAAGKPVPALACKVQDSGEGTCYLVYGGPWGLRLAEPASAIRWSLDDPSQWAEPFLLLPSNGVDLRFSRSVP